MMLTNWVDEDNFSGSFVLPEKCGIYNKFLGGLQVLFTNEGHAMFSVRVIWFEFIGGASALC